MAVPKTYLVTGANRGIGLGLSKIILAREGATLIAAVRNPAGAESALRALPQAKDTRLLILPYDATSPTSATELVSSLSGHGVSAIDVLIANAGVQESLPKLLDVTSDRIARVVQINAIGPVQLASAAKELLRAAKAPVFAATSSAAGSIGTLEMLPVQLALSPYGASKAALNWFVRRLSFEEPWLATVAIHPGTVLTDMATGTDIGDLNWDDLKEWLVSLEDSTNGYMDVVDRLTDEKEKSAGRLISYDGTILPW